MHDNQFDDMIAELDKGHEELDQMAGRALRLARAVTPLEERVATLRTLVAMAP